MSGRPPFSLAGDNGSPSELYGGGKKHWLRRLRLDYRPCAAPSFAAAVDDRYRDDEQSDSPLGPEFCLRDRTAPGCKQEEGLRSIWASADRKARECLNALYLVNMKTTSGGTTKIGSSSNKHTLGADQPPPYPARLAIRVYPEFFFTVKSYQAVLTERERQENAFVFGDGVHGQGYYLIREREEEAASSEFGISGSAITGTTVASSSSSHPHPFAKVLKSSASAGSSSSSRGAAAARRASMILRPAFRGGFIGPREGFFFGRTTPEQGRILGYYPQRLPEEEIDFELAPKFTGPRPGFFFGTRPIRDGGREHAATVLYLGYHRDKAKAFAASSSEALHLSVAQQQLEQQQPSAAALSSKILRTLAAQNKSKSLQAKELSSNGATASRAHAAAGTPGANANTDIFADSTRTPRDDRGDASASAQYSGDQTQAPSGRVGTNFSITFSSTSAGAVMRPFDPGAVTGARILDIVLELAKYDASAREFLKLLLHRPSTIDAWKSCTGLSYSVPSLTDCSKDDAGKQKLMLNKEHGASSGSSTGAAAASKDKEPLVGRALSSVLKRPRFDAAWLQGGHKSYSLRQFVFDRALLAFMYQISSMAWRPFFNEHRVLAAMPNARLLNNAFRLKGEGKTIEKQIQVLQSVSKPAWAQRRVGSPPGRASSAWMGGHAAYQAEGDVYHWARTSNNFMQKSLLYKATNKSLADDDLGINSHSVLAFGSVQPNVNQYEGGRYNNAHTTTYGPNANASGAPLSARWGTHSGMFTPREASLQMTPRSARLQFDGGSSGTPFCVENDALGGNDTILTAPGASADTCSLELDLSSCFRAMHDRLMWQPVAVSSQYRFVPQNRKSILKHEQQMNADTVLASWVNRGNNPRDKGKLWAAREFDPSYSSRTAGGGKTKSENHIVDMKTMPADWSKKFPLRHDQMAAVTWMRERELRAKPFRVEYERMLEGNFFLQDLANWDLELRMQADYSARGGVLANPVGAGKTATVLGLIALDKEAPLPCDEPGAMPQKPPTRFPKGFEHDRKPKQPVATAADSDEEETSSSPAAAAPLLEAGSSTKNKKLNKRSRGRGAKSTSEDAHQTRAAKFSRQTPSRKTPSPSKKLPSAVVAKAKACGSVKKSNSKVKPTAKGKATVAKSKAAGNKAKASPPPSGGRAALQHINDVVPPSTQTAAASASSSSGPPNARDGGKSKKKKVGSSSDATSKSVADQVRKVFSDQEAQVLDHDCFFPSKATLVFVPGHLVDQWEREIAKFMPDHKLNILALRNVNPLKLLTVGDIQRADIVICSYRILFSENYQRLRLKELLFGFGAHFLKKPGNAAATTSATTKTESEKEPKKVGSEEDEVLEAASQREGFRSPAAAMTSAATLPTEANKETNIDGGDTNTMLSASGPTQTQTLNLNYRPTSRSGARPQAITILKTENQQQQGGKSSSSSAAGGENQQPSSFAMAHRPDLSLWIQDRKYGIRTKKRKVDSILSVMDHGARAVVDATGVVPNEKNKYNKKRFVEEEQNKPLSTVLQGPAKERFKSWHFSDRERTMLHSLLKEQVREFRKNPTHFQHWHDSQRDGVKYFRSIHRQALLVAAAVETASRANKSLSERAEQRRAALLEKLAQELSDDGDERPPQAESDGSEPDSPLAQEIQNAQGKAKKKKPRPRGRPRLKPKPIEAAPKAKVLAQKPKVLVASVLLKKPKRKETRLVPPGGGKNKKLLTKKKENKASPGKSKQKRHTPGRKRPGKEMSELLASPDKVAEPREDSLQDTEYFTNCVREFRRARLLGTEEECATALEIHEAQDLRFPLLEMFLWRRVVFDEMHELESFNPKEVDILLRFRALFKWGLTGSPAAFSVRSVNAMASLLSIDLLGVSKEESGLLDQVHQYAEACAVTQGGDRGGALSEHLATYLAQDEYNFDAVTQRLKACVDWFCNCCGAKLLVSHKMPQVFRGTVRCGECGAANHAEVQFRRRTRLDEDADSPSNINSSPQPLPEVGSRVYDPSLRWSASNLMTTNLVEAASSRNSRTRMYVEDRPLSSDLAYVVQNDDVDRRRLHALQYRNVNCGVRWTVPLDVADAGGKGDRLSRSNPNPRQDIFQLKNKTQHHDVLDEDVEARRLHDHDVAPENALVPVTRSADHNANAIAESRQKIVTRSASAIAVKSSIAIPSFSLRREDMLYSDFQRQLVKLEGRLDNADGRDSSSSSSSADEGAGQEYDDVNALREAEREEAVLGMSSIRNKTSNSGGFELAGLKSFATVTAQMRTETLLSPGSEDHGSSFVDVADKVAQRSNPPGLTPAQQAGVQSIPGLEDDGIVEPVAGLLSAASRQLVVAAEVKHSSPTAVNPFNAAEDRHFRIAEERRMMRELDRFRKTAQPRLVAVPSAFALQRWSTLARHPFERSATYQQNAARFLREFAWRRSYPLRVRVVQHVVYVTQMPQERALYLNRVQSLPTCREVYELPAADGVVTSTTRGGTQRDAGQQFATGKHIPISNVEIERRRELLELCSHFAKGTHGSVTGEVLRVLAKRRADVESDLAQVAYFLKQLECCLRVRVLGAESRSSSGSSSSAAEGENEEEEPGLFSSFFPTTMGKNVRKQRDKYYSGSVLGRSNVRVMKRKDYKETENSGPWASQSVANLMRANDASMVHEKGLPKHLSEKIRAVMFHPTSSADTASGSGGAASSSSSSAPRSGGPLLVTKTGAVVSSTTLAIIAASGADTIKNSDPVSNKDRRSARDGLGPGERATLLGGGGASSSSSTLLPPLSSSSSSSAAGVQQNLVSGSTNYDPFDLDMIVDADDVEFPLAAGNYKTSNEDRTQLLPDPVLRKLRDLEKRADENAAASGSSAEEQESGQEPLDLPGIVTRLLRLWNEEVPVLASRSIFHDAFKENRPGDGDRLDALENLGTLSRRKKEEQLQMHERDLSQLICAQLDRLLTAYQHYNFFRKTLDVYADSTASSAASSVGGDVGDHLSGVGSAKKNLEAFLSDGNTSARSSSSGSSGSAGNNISSDQKVLALDQQSMNNKLAEDAIEEVVSSAKNEKLQLSSTTFPQADAAASFTTRVDAAATGENNAVVATANAAIAVPAQLQPSGNITTSHGIKNPSRADQRYCAICTEYHDVSELGITPCAHVFCVVCLNAMVENQRKCAICRQPLHEKDILSLSSELHAWKTEVVQQEEQATMATLGQVGKRFRYQKLTRGSLLSPAVNEGGAVFDQPEALLEPPRKISKKMTMKDIKKSVEQQDHSPTHGRFYPAKRQKQSPDGKKSQKNFAGGAQNRKNATTTTSDEELDPQCSAVTILEDVAGPIDFVRTLIPKGQIAFPVAANVGSTTANDSSTSSASSSSSSAGAGNGKNEAAVSSTTSTEKELYPLVDIAATYGSKMQKLAELLTKIKGDDKNAKILVYSQWDKGNKLAFEALQNLQHLSCHLFNGGVAAKARLLRRFADAEPGKASLDVLLIPLDFGASGLNMVLAQHIVFVHPFSFPSVAQTRAAEAQAIGRVCRPGQARGDIHVWRLCTLNTVEEELINERCGNGSSTGGNVFHEEQAAPA
ncbi:unnamed protein product [Amoebophrya sp. A120]|nr:unnamed protein product [Amoebophrya sp. A120]|eukprot:GSA120T00004037001.1